MAFPVDSTTWAATYGAIPARGDGADVEPERDTGVAGGPGEQLGEDGNAGTCTTPLSVM